jgi:hypothetical protein
MTHTEAIFATLRAGGFGDLADQAVQYGITTKHVETRHGPVNDPTRDVRSDLWHATIGDDDNEAGVLVDISLLRRIHASPTSLTGVTTSCTLVNLLLPTIEATEWVIHAWESEGWHKSLT